MFSNYIAVVMDECWAANNLRP